MSRVVVTDTTTATTIAADVTTINFLQVSRTGDPAAAVMLLSANDGTSGLLVWNNETVSASQLQEFLASGTLYGRAQGAPCSVELS